MYNWKGFYKMTNVLFIGDVHLSPQTPISRKDDYPTTILNKLTSIIPLLQQHDIKHIIFLGDLFNTRNLTLKYLIQCYQSLKQLSQYSQLHLIVGNHDILYATEDTLNQSPIQLLLDSNLFTKESFSVDDTTFNLFDYTTPTTQLPQSPSTNYNILVGHYFYNLGFGDTEHTITKQQALDLHYDAYVLGHDHTPYEPILTDTYEVHRPGSLSRASSNTSQLHRSFIQVLLYTTVKHTFTYLDVPNVLPPDQVYKDTIFTLPDFSLDSDIDFSQLLSQFDYDNTQDIEQALSSIQIPEDIYLIVIQYLHDEGIFLKGDESLDE